MDLRQTFFEELIKLAEQDDKIVLIVPDVGFSFTEQFAEKFPDRYFNFGVTEQSSMIIAAALALSGFKPYFYTMINFALFRPYEMVRNAVIQHHANVKIIGVKGSEKYKFLGFSHNLVQEDEDIKAWENLDPAHRWVTPQEEEVSTLMKTLHEDSNPWYIRL